jgi:predicted lysophospholipase L1 biosynthesis ABC-type transport system permease subunit
VRQSQANNQDQGVTNMDNNTKLELITAITNCTDSNEYELAEKLLEILGVKIGDTVDANPADIFSTTDMLNSIEPETIADYLENEKGYKVN